MMSLLRSRRVRIASFATMAAVVLAAVAVLALPTLRMRMNQGAVVALRDGGPVDASRFDDAWFDAARLGRVDILSALREARYPLDRRTSAGYTAVILAAYDAQPAALDYLLQSGADACAADRNGNTALMGAIYKGNLPEARRLLRTGCPIDQANNAGETAFGFAVLFGRTTLFEALLRGGSDPAHRDVQGKTAFDIAREQGDEATVRALAQAVGRRGP